MYKGYKVIPFVPAGRQKTMEILVKYFIKNADIIDEVQIWLNTTEQSDINYLRELCNINPLFKLYEIPKEYNFISKPIQYNTRAFYNYTIDPEAIYIRFDDDIIYIDDDYFKNLLDFRIENQEYFLVFGNIVNNAMCAYLQQEAGAFPKDRFNIDNGFCMNMKTWGNPNYAIYIHNLLIEKILEKKVKQFYFPNKELVYERFSISNFAFMGKEFAKFGGKIPDLDEEIFLTEKYVKEKDLKNIICGNAVVSHYTFSPWQKPKVKETDILEQYNKIADNKLSADYYKLLSIEK